MALSTNSGGMRSRASSSSVVKRGQLREKAQHAPQLRQSMDRPTTFPGASAGMIPSRLIVMSFHEIGALHLSLTAQQCCNQRPYVDKSACRHSHSSQNRDSHKEKLCVRAHNVDPWRPCKIELLACSSRFVPDVRRWIPNRVNRQAPNKIYMAQSSARDPSGNSGERTSLLQGE
jgi:hypothetical protein